MVTVVTGACGHVGNNLIRALKIHGRTVRALIRKNSKAISDLNVENVIGDVCDLPSLYSAFEGAEIVYHLAAHISLSNDDWPLTKAINIEGTRNVIDACLKSGVKRLIHFSSIHAHCQRPFDVPVNEDSFLVTAVNNPPYDRSKAGGELEVKKGVDQGLDAIIINPTGIIGPYDYKPSHFGKIILSLARGKLPIMLDSGFNWVDVRDVVERAITAEETAKKGAKYMFSGHWVSMRDMINEIRKITGESPVKFYCPMWLAPAGLPFVSAISRVAKKKPLYSSVSLNALRSNRNVSHERATSELGYHPRPFLDTINDTLRWFKDNGYY